MNSYTPSLLYEIQLTEDGTQRSARYVLAVGGKEPHRKKKKLPKVYSYAVTFSVF